MRTGRLTWKDARNSAGAVGGDGIERAAFISDADSVNVCWVEWERDRVVGVMLDKVKPM